jgi:hypothetical protein
MPRLLKGAPQSSYFIVVFGAIVVAVATWLAAQSEDMSTLLFLVVLVSAGVAHYLGQGALLSVMVLMSVLLFLVPFVWRRAPSAPEHWGRFNRVTCLWLLGYLVALFWFPSDHSL